MSNYTYKLHVKPPNYYCGIREHNVRITDVGRHSIEDENGNMKTWSSDSRNPIPSQCQIPDLKIPPSLPISLHINKDRRKPSFQHTDTYFYSQNILNWARQENFNLSNIDFFISRRPLKIFSMTPSCGKEEWLCWIYVYDQKIFIESPNNVSDTEPVWWGKSYEDLMRTGGRGTPSYGGEDVDVRVSRVINIGNHHILTSAKVSCQYPGRMKDIPENYVELKSMRELISSGVDVTFRRHKARDVWAHCFLVNMNNVYFGFRTNRGMLAQIRKYTVEELKREGRDWWRPTEMLSFLDFLLTWISENVVEKQSYTMCFKGEFVDLYKEEHPVFISTVRDSYPLQELSK